MLPQGDICVSHCSPTQECRPSCFFLANISQHGYVFTARVQRQFRHQDEDKTVFTFPTIIYVHSRYIRVLMMPTTRSPIYSHHAPRSKYEIFAADNATCSAPSVAVRSLYRVRPPFCCSARCRCVLYTNRSDKKIILLLLLLWKDAITNLQATPSHALFSGRT